MTTQQRPLATVELERLTSLGEDWAADQTADGALETPGEDFDHE
jgi:hypothetical protein